MQRRAFAANLDEVEPGWQEVRFPRLYRDGEAKELVVSRPQSVVAGTLLVAHPVWQLFEAVDPVEHDGAVLHGRADQLVATASQREEQLPKSLEVEHVLIAGRD
jgi:hypothetical protein